MIATVWSRENTQEWCIIRNCSARNQPSSMQPWWCKIIIKPPLETLLHTSIPCLLNSLNSRFYIKKKQRDVFPHTMKIALLYICTQRWKSTSWRFSWECCKQCWCSKVISMTITTHDGRINRVFSSLLVHTTQTLNLYTYLFYILLHLYIFIHIYYIFNPCKDVCDSLVKISVHPHLKKELDINYYNIIMLKNLNKRFKKIYYWKKALTCHLGCWFWLFRWKAT